MAGLAFEISLKKNIAINNRINKKKNKSQRLWLFFFFSNLKDYGSNLKGLRVRLDPHKGKRKATCIQYRPSISPYWATGLPTGLEAFSSGTGHIRWYITKKRTMPT
jgi:hypothetical protein